MKELNPLKITSASRCQKKNKDIEMQIERNDNYKRAAIVKDCIKLFYESGRPVSEVDQYLEEAFKELSFVNEANKQAVVGYYTSLVKRFLRADRKPLVPKKILPPVEVGGYKLKINPDLIFLDKTIRNGKEYDIVEVAVIKLGEPTISKRGRSAETNIDRNLGILSMLQYGRQYLPTGNGFVRASYYFLKKKNEKNNYEDDFEESTNVAFKETYFVPGVEDVTIDVLREELRLYEQGSSCTKAMCDACEQNLICNYKKATVAEKEEAVKKSYKDLKLSPEQKQAVGIEEGIWRINAGAGVGKTLVVALRVVQLLLNGVKPERILLTTFTNTGVEEMRERIEILAEDYGVSEYVDLSKLNILTLNSFGNIILENHYADLGFTQKPVVADKVDKYDILTDILKENPEEINGLDYKNIYMNLKNAKGAIPYLCNAFEGIEAENLDDKETFIKYANMVQDETAVMEAEKILDLYKKFKEKMVTNNSILYSDQDKAATNILPMFPNLFEEELVYEHIIVDEFQDCSETQINLLAELISTTSFKSLMVVGDDSQAIYGFRHTSPKYLIHFEDYIGESVEDIYIVNNRRSTKNIITCANFVNALNTERVEKDLVTDNELGSPVEVAGFKTKKEENNWVAEQIEKKVKEKTPLSDIAYIARTKSELVEMQKLLHERGIMSMMAVPEPVLNNSNVQAAIEFAQFATNPENTKSLTVYLNAVLRNNLMNLSTEQINKLIKKNQEDFINVYGNLPYEERVDMIYYCLDMLSEEDDEVYAKFLEMLKDRKYMADKLLDYIIKFRKYESDLAIAQSGKFEAVTLTTAHSSKGKEWNTVFTTISQYDTLIPMRRDEVEETRRLIFVAMTRARKELTVTSTERIGAENNPNCHRHKFFWEILECPGIKIVSDFM